ncbi:hypothetical protein [Deinococcus frigens]|uniref:hypothetical protein n=1 Tax=Deinococcus frigens TaxID=249403 RepID=UPI0004971C43|nr:hypothetical protein [Deinococcus frigens]
MDAPISLEDLDAWLNTLNDLPHPVLTLRSPTRTLRRCQEALGHALQGMRLGADERLLRLLPPPLLP